MNGRLVCAADTIAAFADALPLDLDVHSFAVVDVRKGHLCMLGDRLHLHLPLGARATGTASAAHEHAENVVHASAATATLFESLQSVLVVDLSLLAIVQDVISLLDLFELLQESAEDCNLPSQDRHLCRDGS